jgi:hypothetical protein
MALTAAVGVLADAASSQVISGSQITFTGDTSSPIYHAEVVQTIAGDLTGISFTYSGTTLSFNSEAADEGSDWHLTNPGDMFSASTIAAGQFPVLINLDGIPPPLAIPLGDFYLGMSTGTGSTKGVPNRNVYGWLELDNTGAQLIPVDNAVAYGDQGIIIGTTTAIVPEPSAAALLLAAAPLLMIRRRRARLLGTQR